MWHVAGTGWLYVIQDVERAGTTVVTVSVRNLDHFVVDWERRGISVGPIESHTGAGRKVDVEDADVHVINSIEVSPRRHR